MPTHIDIYYQFPKGYKWPQDILLLAKNVQKKVRKGLWECKPTLLSDIQPENQGKRIFQPYSLFLDADLSLGIMAIRLVLLVSESQQILNTWLQWWQKNREILYLNNYRPKLTGYSELHSIEPSEMLQDLPTGKYLTLNFISPVSFGEQQIRYEQHIPTWNQPMPNRLMKDLLQRWHYFFSDYQLNPELPEAFGQQVLIQGKIRRVCLNPYPKRIEFQAFEGKLTFPLPEDQQLRSQTIALARFATWSGIGTKNTMGLGQVAFELSETV